MITKILKEAGKEEALLGLSLSYNSEPSERVGNRLAHKGGGESKFLESIDVWLDVTASRYLWSQLDTYRLTTKQSESTMHTLTRRELVRWDFEGGDVHPASLQVVNNYIERGDLLMAKKHLPESFLQRRVWKVSYATLQNLVKQRDAHKLPEWQQFISTIREGVEKPEWIFNA